MAGSKASMERLGHMDEAVREKRRLPVRNQKEVVAQPLKKLDLNRKCTRQQDAGLKGHFVTALSI